MPTVSTTDNFVAFFIFFYAIATAMTVVSTILTIFFHISIYYQYLQLIFTAESPIFSKSGAILQDFTQPEQRVNKKSEKIK